MIFSGTNFKSVSTSNGSCYLLRGGCSAAGQANYECDPGYEISRADDDVDDRERALRVRSANRVCSQSGIWLPEERIQCVKTRWGLVQGSAKKWSLGCVIPASWVSVASEACFMQPRDHSLADPCTLHLTSSVSKSYCRAVRFT